MINLNCPGDYELLRKWLEEHKNATLVYDTVSGLPVKAEYACPIYTAYIEEPQRFFAKVRDLLEREHE